MTDSSRGSRSRTKTGGIDASRIESRIYEVANQERHQRGYLPLAWDADLVPMARYHSQQMSERDELYHVSPDGEGLGDRADLFEYDVIAKTSGQPFCHECGADLRPHQSPAYCPDCGTRTPYQDPSAQAGGVLGENVAFHLYETSHLHNTDEGIVANSTVNGWLGSPEHRENLLAERFERMAIGVDVVADADGNTRIYVTQNLS